MRDGKHGEAAAEPGASVAPGRRQGRKAAGVQGAPSRQLRPLGDGAAGDFAFARGTTQDSSAQYRADQAALEVTFERALATLRMWFQPIVRARDFELFGYEALMRTRDAELCNPIQMLDAAERLHRIHALGRSVRALVACGCAAAPPHRGVFFVNLHPLDLLDKSLLSPYSPLARVRHRVVLEITERASLEHLGDIVQRVAQLREMGYRVAIDDLGAGHSRMDTFQPLDTDFVKLDMCLVRDIDRHPMKRELVRSVAKLCADQGIEVIAEGVETAAELETVTGLGCGLVQGYLVARPSAQLADVGNLEPRPGTR